MHLKIAEIYALKHLLTCVPTENFRRELGSPSPSPDDLEHAFQKILPGARSESPRVRPEDRSSSERPTASPKKFLRTIKCSPPEIRLRCFDRGHGI